MTLRTSATHPIEINTLPLPGGGRLGLTFCPGKRDIGGGWDRDLDTDLGDLAGAGVELLVTLVEDHELTLLGVPDLGTRVQAHGMDWLHLPIVDVSVPSAAFESGWPVHGAHIVSRLSAGGFVVVHCRGGLGRAGTVAAWLLVELGESPEHAISRVRATRPGAIETDGQARFVRARRPLGFDGAAAPETR